MRVNICLDSAWTWFKQVKNSFFVCAIYSAHGGSVSAYGAELSVPRPLVTAPSPRQNDHITSLNCPGRNYRD